MQQLRLLLQLEARHVRSRPRPTLQAATRHCAVAGSRWTCPCGFHNYAFHTECFRCNVVRDGAATPLKATPMSLLGAQAEAAAEAAAVAAAAVTPAEGVWMCAACNTFNNAQRGRCTHCGEQRPGPRPKSHSQKTADTSGFAPAASPRFSHQQTSAKQRFRDGDWFCSCGAHNFARNTLCRECQAAAPLERKPAPRTGGSGGDWVCKECGKYNFARRTECMQCHHPQPPMRKEEIFNKDATDAASEGWVCSVCHSMNPVEVGSACVICGSPK